MVYITVFLSLLSLFLSINCSELETDKAIKNISVEYDDEGYPTPISLKKALLEEYFNPSDDETISIEQISQKNYTGRMYVVTIHKNGLTAPILYLRIDFNCQVRQELVAIEKESIDQEYIKKSDNEGIYPVFIPENLPINILIENLFCYKDQNENIRTIELISITHELSVENENYTMSDIT
jgi:hypothetical protein